MNIKTIKVTICGYCVSSFFRIEDAKQFIEWQFPCMIPALAEAVGRAYIGCSALNAFVADVGQVEIELEEREEE